MSTFELALSLVLGIGLAAATGFRVFLPMLIVSVAAYTGHLALGESFRWLATPGGADHARRGGARGKSSPIMCRGLTTYSIPWRHLALSSQARFCLQR